MSMEKTWDHPVCKGLVRRRPKVPGTAKPDMKEMVGRMNTMAACQKRACLSPQLTLIFILLLLFYFIFSNGQLVIEYLLEIH